MEKGVSWWVRTKYGVGGLRKQEGILRRWVRITK